MIELLHAVGFGDLLDIRADIAARIRARTNIRAPGGARTMAFGP